MSKMKIIVLCLLVAGVMTGCGWADVGSFVSALGDTVVQHADDLDQATESFRQNLEDRGLNPDDYVLPEPSTPITSTVPVTTTVPVTDTIPANPALTAPPITEVNDPGECHLTGAGLILAMRENDDGGWVFDPMHPETLVPNVGYTDRSDLSGCNFLVQGQKNPDEHIGNIWVLRDVFSTGSYDLSWLEMNGTFLCSNCSVWAFPAGWNMQTFGAPEGDPIAGAYVTDLRDNMVNNITSPHDWPIWLHLTTGEVLVYAPNETAGIQTGPSCVGLTEPQLVKVTGIVGESVYVGSLGETECWSVGWFDGSNEYETWFGAADNVQFETVEYWLMPGDWDEQMVVDWANNQ